MRRIKNEDQIKVAETAHAINRQESKTYDYRPEDFEIVPICKGSIVFKWRHKSWKTWCAAPINGKGIIAVKTLINRYIFECKKPYGKRDLSFIHLYND